MRGGRATTGSAVDVREYREEDEAEVLRLLTTTLGGGPAGQRPAEFFRWKHVANPFGRSLMLVAETEGRVIGLRAFMRWRFRAGDRLIPAVRAVDTATHPEHQGRGVFTMLTGQALERLRGGVDFVFNTPNEQSLPGYLKMGWQIVGRVPVSVRVRRPLRLIRRLRSVRSGTESMDQRPSVDAPTASEVLERTDLIGLVLSEAEIEPRRLVTPRDDTYLRWRYAAPPLLGYHAILREVDGHPQGFAIFRVRRRGALWESTVSELIVRRGDERAARRLLREVVHAAPVDHVTCSLPAGSVAGRAARRCGFLPAPEGMTFVVNTLRPDVEPPPTNLASWALSLGDLEVF